MGRKGRASFFTLKEYLCNPQFRSTQTFQNLLILQLMHLDMPLLPKGEIGKNLHIAYTSRVLRGPELSYEVYEKEALAMIHAVKIFRSYIGSIT